MKRLLITICFFIIATIVFISCKKETTENKPFPKAKFGADTTYISLGDSVQFIDSSSNAPYNWKWILPGTSVKTSDQQYPKVKYDSLGVFPVTLIAHNIYGNDTLFKDSFIVVIPGPIPFPCGNTFTDERDAKVYETVKIGQQCWMAKNLNHGTFVSSTNTGVSHSNVNNNSTIEKYCLNNIESNCDIYGGLYDWNEMMSYLSTESIKGVCPQGWHLPSDTEWNTMLAFVGANAGTDLQSAGTSGFNTLLGGARSHEGYFFGVDSDTYFWTSSKSAGSLSWSRNLHSASVNVLHAGYKTSYGYAVRCIKDGNFSKKR